MARRIARSFCLTHAIDDSEAVEDDKFLGLALDDVNEDDKTEERIDAWIEAIKPAL
jgi:flavodoxin I